MKDYFSEEIGNVSSNSPRDYFAEEIGTPRKTLGSNTFTALEKAKIDEERLKTNSSFANANPMLAGLETTAKDVAAIPYHFANQFAANIPRSLLNTIAPGENIGSEMAQTQSPIAGAVANVAGVGGAIASPLNRLAISKGLGGQYGQAAATGALQGAVYAPTDNFNDLSTRGVQAVGGAVMAPAVAGVSNFIGSKLPPLTTGQAAQKFSDIVDVGINKGIKPSTAKGSFGNIEKYGQKAEEAVQTILNNKDALTFIEDGQSVTRAPKTVKEFSDAVSQTKENIFKQYDAMATQAGDQKLTIPVLNAAKELDAVAQDKALYVVNPMVQKYATDLQSRLRLAGEQTPSAIQDMIKQFNGGLQAFYKNPSYESAGKAGVDAMVVNILRKDLDNAIEKTVAPGYQTLKNQYGALSTIEKDVARAAQRTANYQPKSLLDFTDIYTGAELLRGIATLNPADLIAGTGGRFLKEVYKRLNSPDAQIEKMFNRGGKALGQKSQLMAQEQGLKPANKLTELVGKGIGGAKEFYSKENAEKAIPKIGLTAEMTENHFVKPSGLNELSAGAGLLGVGSALKKDKKIDDKQAILAIIGESESSPDGMKEVANAIKRRGSLKGVYGVNAPRVTGKKYSEKTYELAKKAWEQSKAGEATNWFSDADLKLPKVQKMLKHMKFINKVGGNNFYKEIK